MNSPIATPVNLGKVIATIDLPRYYGENLFLRRDKPFSLSDESEEMLERVCEDHPQTVDLIKVTPSEMGFGDNVLGMDVIARGEELGLSLCPRSVPMVMLEHYSDRPALETSAFVVAHRPIWVRSRSAPFLFFVYKVAWKKELNAVCVCRECPRRPNESWLFCRPTVTPPKV